MLFRSTISVFKSFIPECNEIEEEIPINKSVLAGITPLKMTRDEKYLSEFSKNPTQSSSKCTFIKKKSFVQSNQRTIIKLKTLMESSIINLKGVLEKYHPRFSLSYFPRECIITRSYFEYHSVSVNHVKFPLLRIWFDDIESVNRINVYSDNKKSNRHQFEIIMKSTWSLKQNSAPFNRSIILQNTSKRTRNKRSIYTLIAHTDKSVEGHLMPKPPLLNKYRNELNEQFITNPIEEKFYYVKGIKFSDAYEAKLFEDYMNENEYKLAKMITEEKITSKNPNKWINSLSGLHTWNNRALEWYLAEERMLFSAKSEVECNKWVLLLNWLLYCNK